MADSNFGTPAKDGGVTADSTIIGGGTRVKKLQMYSAVLSPAAVAINTTAEQIFAVAGVIAATDTVLEAIKAAPQAGLGIVGSRVTTDGNIGITFSNNTAGAITPTAAETYKFFVVTT